MNFQDGKPLCGFQWLPVGRFLGRLAGTQPWLPSLAWPPRMQERCRLLAQGRLLGYGPEHLGECLHYTGNPGRTSPCQVQILV